MADRPYETRRNVVTCAEARETDDGWTFDGFASTYNEPYAVGHFDERVAPTAFSRTMGRNPDVPLLVDHVGQPLARTSSGTLTLDHKTAVGLRSVAPLEPSDPDVQRLVPKMRRRDINAMSFAFRVMENGDEWDYSNERPMRTLRDLDLHGGDVSIVTYPANGGTFASLRGDTGRQEACWVLADAMLFDVRKGRAFDKRSLSHLHGALDDLGLALRDVEDVNGLRTLRTQWEEARSLALDVARDIQAGIAVDPDRLQRAIAALQSADSLLDDSLAPISGMLSIPSGDTRAERTEAEPEIPLELARRAAEADALRAQRA